MVYSLDRFSRNTWFTMEAVWALSDKGVNFSILSQTYNSYQKSIYFVFYQHIKYKDTKAKLL